MPSKPRLINIANTVPTVGQRRVKPSVYLSPIAHPISNNPAVTRITQFIDTFLMHGAVPDTGWSGEVVLTSKSAHIEVSGPRGFLRSPARLPGYAA